jgi:hypothetical protein
LPLVTLSGGSGDSSRNGARKEKARFTTLAVELDWSGHQGKLGSENLVPAAADEINAIFPPLVPLSCFLVSKRSVPPAE